MSFNQSLGQRGQVYATLAKTDFWQKEFNQESWQVGYNHNYKGIFYGLYYQKQNPCFRAQTTMSALTSVFRLIVQ